MESRLEHQESAEGKVLICVRFLSDLEVTSKSDVYDERLPTIPQLNFKTHERTFLIAFETFPNLFPFIEKKLFYFCRKFLFSLRNCIISLIFCLRDNVIPPRCSRRASIPFR